MFANIKSVLELFKMYPDEKSCTEHLEAIFWRGIPESPYCAGAKVYKYANGRYKCAETKRYFNVRTGTMFDNTKIPLQTWFYAIWIVCGHKKGISSMQLSRDIDVTQKTAWFMLQRIRACFGIENYNELEGVVEADESFYGGKNKNRHANKKFEKAQGRSFKDKVPILGMIQRGGKMTAVVVKDTQKEALTAAVTKYVKQDTVLITDDWGGYNGIKDHCEHRVIKDVSKGYRNDYDPETHTNNIEGSWKIMKNSMRDMYNHVSRKHIQFYIDEFVFRYNMRKFVDSDKFNHLVANSNVRTKYKDLISA
jgi:transposase-like protein